MDIAREEGFDKIGALILEKVRTTKIKILNLHMKLNYPLEYVSLFRFKFDGFYQNSYFLFNNSFYLMLIEDYCTGKYIIYI